MIFSRPRFWDGLWEGIIGRVIRNVLFHRDRQLAGGIHYAEEYLRKGLPAILPGKPGVKQGTHLISPRLHVETAATVQNDDCLGVELRGVQDQVVLKFWQSE